LIRLLGAVAVLALGAAADAAGAAFTLTDADQQAAMRAGERSTASDGFDREWRVAGDDGASVLILTPFHRLLLAARHATFKNEPLKPTDVARVLKQDAQRLVLWVDLRGKTEDFARRYVPRLASGPREIKASFVQNERTALPQSDGSYLARCVYGFPVRDLDPRGRVVLTVADGDGHDVSRFTIELSAMR
jgi:hypothetical protein